MCLCVYIIQHESAWNKKNINKSYYISKSYFVKIWICFFYITKERFLAFDHALIKVFLRKQSMTPGCFMALLSK